MNSSDENVESKQLVSDEGEAPGAIHLGCVVGSEVLKAIESDSILPGVLVHLSTALRDQYGNSIDASELKGKLVGLYFSAGWCGPCRQFTPILSKFHNDNIDDFRVVFVSMDRSEQAMLEYIRGKGFLRVDYGSRARKDLISALSVSSLPTLIVVNPEGEIVTSSGRFAINSNPERCIEEWHKGSSGVRCCKCLSSLCFGSYN
mmetsp:Transcript_3909/g.7197  ORF Transcript_3909/g.7197 Transcript_3909/m.7197 type:complete len:203 (+) Transcript_3909:147-755(+)